MFLPEWELMGLPGWNHEDGRFRLLGELIFRSSFLSKFNLDSGFGIRYEHDVLYVNGEEQYSFRFFHFLFCTFFHEFFATPFHQHYPDRA